MGKEGHGHKGDKHHGEKHHHHGDKHHHHGDKHHGHGKHHQGHHESSSHHGHHGHHHGHESAEGKHGLKTHSRTAQRKHQNDAIKHEHKAKKLQQKKELLHLDDHDARPRKLSVNTKKHLKPLRRSSFQRLYGSSGDPAAEATRAHYAAQANAKISGFLTKTEAGHYLDFVAESTGGGQAATDAYDRRERRRQAAKQGDGFCMWFFDACVSVLCGFCFMCPRPVVILQRTFLD